MPLAAAAGGVVCAVHSSYSAAPMPPPLFQHSPLRDCMPAHSSHHLSFCAHHFSSRHLMPALARSSSSPFILTIPFPLGCVRQSSPSPFAFESSICLSLSLSSICLSCKHTCMFGLSRPFIFELPHAVKQWRHRNNCHSVTGGAKAAFSKPA